MTRDGDWTKPHPPVVRQSCRQRRLTNSGQSAHDRDFAANSYPPMTPHFTAGHSYRGQRTQLRGGDRL
jgi:hypothetical protein